MNRMLAVKRVTLTEKHLRPGRTIHEMADRNGRRPFPPFTSLTIVQYEGASQYYLMYHCADGLGTDGLHDSLENALWQAEWEFEVRPEEWVDVDEEFCW